MADVVHELLATEAAIGKLGARTISADEAGQLARNEHVTVRNRTGKGGDATTDDRQNRRWQDPDARDRANHRPHHMADRDRLSSTEYVERHEGDPNATLRILVSVEGEDARRMERIAEARGATPHDVVAELLRDGDRPGLSR